MAQKDLQFCGFTTSLELYIGIEGLTTLTLSAFYKLRRLAGPEIDAKLSILVFGLYKGTMTSPFQRLLAVSLSTLVFSFAAFAEPPKPQPHQASYAHLNGIPVGEIQVKVREIFDDPNASTLYQTINQLKISTQEDVVRRELIIHEGEKFDEFLLRESERNLRNLGYFREVQIIPHLRGNVVDLEVSVQDTWTLIPQFSYSSGTGRNKRSAGITESDFLGLGKRLEVAYEEEDARSSLQGVYQDNRVFGTLNSFLGAHLERSDGQRTIVSFGRPFRSLVERQAWNVSLDTSNTLGRLFEFGDERYVFRQRHTDVGFKYTWARGDPKISVGRYSLGYGYVEDRFNQADLGDYEDLNVDPDSVSQDPALLADNRRYSGPSLGYSHIQPDFISMNYIDRFERVEDYNLGNEFTLNSMLAFDSLGSLGDSVLLNGNNAAGIRFSRSSFLRGEIGGATRYDSDGFANNLIRTQVRYYNVLGMLTLKDLNLGRHTLAAGLSLDYGSELDRDRELLLGADNGLRGYEARTFTGDKRLILNLEDRMHFIDDAFKLVSIGGAFFIDAGGTTDGAFGDILAHNFYSNVGVGLRLAFPRSTGGRVLRVDVAFPMRDGPDDSNAWEPRLILSGGQVFGSHLLSEVEGAERANVTIGFDR